jgi:hypothetical protein
MQLGIGGSRVADELTGLVTLLENNRLAAT